MLQQCEWVPQSYELDEPDTSSLCAPKVHSPSINLHSTDGPERCSLQFEAIRPNVFRTAFTTPSHPLPPYSSVKVPTPSFGAVQPKVTTKIESCTRTIKCGQVYARINWSHAPVISLGFEGDDRPIHEDLHDRSYAIDSTGIAHYTVYWKDTLHVGLGEKAAPMDLSGRGFIISASDTFGYDAYRTDPLYKHIPLLINVRRGACVAIFSTSHSRGSWSVGSEMDGLWGPYKVYRQSHGGLEEYLIIGKTVADVVRSYAELVGFPLLVPRYMMGYIGGGMKYSMMDSPRACDVILEFIKKCEEEEMPCSAFQMSSGYTVAETEPKTRNVFTWNQQRFPDPQSFTRECHKHGVRLLANIKPYILANHPDYAKLAQARGLFLDPDTGRTAVTRLWSAGGGESGEGSHLDFTSKGAAKWWYDGVQSLKRMGIDAMWNDNNEFNIYRDDWLCALQTIPVPEGVQSKEIGLWGRAMHTELMGKTSHDALFDIEPTTRPLVLTRSATAGTMRYCASSWSGDNVTSWEGMRASNALALNAGFSLLQSYGHDIGGFEGPQPTPELLVRWIQLGIHSPRFAINCYKTNPSDNLVGDVIEPWQYPSVAPIIRVAIKRRYELVPYTYSLMLQSHHDATPPQRWTGWGYESDPNVWSKALSNGETQYWFGDALLVAGVYEPGRASASVYLPRRSPGADTAGFLNLSAPYQYLKAGQWHEVASDWQTSIPILARIGSAIPVGKPIPTTCLAGEDPEFPGMEMDDWRGIEIFPCPVTCQSEQNQKQRPEPRLEESTEKHPQSDPEQEDEVKWFHSQWLEDDGISCEEKVKVNFCEAKVAYCISDRGACIQAKVSIIKHGSFEPLWVQNGVSIIMPVGEDRPVECSGSDVQDCGRDSKGRRVWMMPIEIVNE